jgi:hypothetical protein
MTAEYRKTWAGREVLAVRENTSRKTGTFIATTENYLKVELPSALYEGVKSGEEFRCVAG